jgi:hypothetical protein
MSLQILRESQVEQLRKAISLNESKYRSNKVWLVDEKKSSSIFLKTNVEPNAPFDLLDPDGDDLKDVENSIRLHKALSMLTPVQARDPRLWTRLAHVEFWPYMRQRWHIERFKTTPAKIPGFILSRYFVAQNQSRALTRHGIARLWWYGCGTGGAGARRDLPPAPQGPPRRQDGQRQREHPVGDRHTAQALGIKRVVKDPRAERLFQHEVVRTLRIARGGRHPPLGVREEPCS